MKAEKESTSSRVRLMQQARVGDGFVYYFKFEDVVMTIGITPRVSVGDPDGWRAEVQIGKAPDEVKVSEWGATRGAALSSVGAAWASSPATQDFPRFDWDVVTEALQTVRAI